MHDFEPRRDRYEHFQKMASPSVTLCFPLNLPDFRPWCKAQGLGPFHVLLYAVLHAVAKLENFRYRVFDGEVIRIDKLKPAYTVVNQHNDLNFAQFDWSDDLREFVARSVQARDEASQMTGLNPAYQAMSPRECKDQVFITCIPWLDFTSIEHPVPANAGHDIPALAWGKFRYAGGGRLHLPFSVQAHHGFVDGFHIHQLAQQIEQELTDLMR
ncbi:MAG: CatA-like O-acetyltransferase [Pseudomonadota bacterium]